jgi:3-deoxy-D-manno-octulosonic-acid transferase
MRLIYTLAWLGLLPVAFLYLLWRARRQPEYRRHWAERLGMIDLPDHRPLIWLHAVSVGETQAAKPLVQALLERYPDHALLITHATPTGRATAAEIFGDRVMQAYLPYDLPWLVGAFLDRARPRVGIFMETEIWPNLFAACRARQLPIFLVNARLSERSAQGYRKLAPLTRATLACLTGVAAQTGADADRLASLGADKVVVTGNMKFDVQPPPDALDRARLLREFFPNRFVVLAASTRDGEEPLILAAFSKLAVPGLLLLIVPRHPQRFDAVAELLRRRGIDFLRRSDRRPVPPETQVLLGDSMGEMAAYYAACDVAFIGGSLLPLGGQNLIEAAAAGRPILIGPHTWNFREVSEQAIAAGAALRVQSAEELAVQVRSLFDRPEMRVGMGEAGRAFAEKHRGATARVMAMLASALPGPGG